MNAYEHFINKGNLAAVKLLRILDDLDLNLDEVMQEIGETASPLQENLLPLKRILKLFKEYGEQYSFTGDSWVISNGAYDLNWTIYYEEYAVIECVDNVAKIINHNLLNAYDINVSALKSLVHSILYCRWAGESEGDS